MGVTPSELTGAGGSSEGGRSHGPGTRVLPALVAPGMRGRCRGPGLWLRCARVSGPEFSVAVAGGDWHQLTCRCRGRGVAARCGVVPGDGGDPQPVHGGRVDGGAAGPAGEGDGERAVSGAGVADGVLATRPVRLPAWSVTSRTVRPSGCSRHRICQSLTGSRALICGRAAVTADPVAIGPVAAAGLAAVIGCSGVGRAVVIRRRAGDRCCG